MRPLTRILSLVAILTGLTAAAFQVLPSPDAALGEAELVAETTTAPAQGDTIALYLSGRIATKTVDQATDSWTGDLISLATGGVAGTLRHEITCHNVTSFPCMVFTSTDTFALQGGTIVARGTESVAPYAAAEPGIFHVGIHPQGNSIISATGVFEGRTGRAQLLARHDGREYPGHVTFDDFWLIKYDPKA